MDHTARFYNLFDGRHDVYGGDDGRAIYQPYNEATALRHLEGIEGIGVYPCMHAHDGNLWVKWGCCDIDTGDWNEAFMLATALQGMGLRPWIERSRSKGWHVWVFVNSWIPASDMRRCLKVAYSAIDLQAKEANPKQETLRENQLGNYVRLPYKAGLIINPERQCMMAEWNRYSDGVVLTFPQFIEGKDQRFQSAWGDPYTWKHPGFYSDTNVVSRWAAKWYERPKQLEVSTETPAYPSAQVIDIAARLPQNTGRVWKWGPKTADRSATLQAIAFQCARSGFKPADTYQLILDADRRWGKYHQRPDGEGYIADIVERAYS